MMNSNDLESNRRSTDEIAIQTFTWRMSSFMVTAKYKAKGVIFQKPVSSILSAPSVGQSYKQTDGLTN